MESKLLKSKEDRNLEEIVVKLAKEGIAIINLSFLGQMAGASLVGYTLISQSSNIDTTQFFYTGVALTILSSYCTLPFLYCINKKINQLEKIKTNEEHKNLNINLF